MTLSKRFFEDIFFSRFFCAFVRYFAEQTQQGKELTFEAQNDLEAGNLMAFMDISIIEWLSFHGTEINLGEFRGLEIGRDGEESERKYHIHVSNNNQMQQHYSEGQEPETGN